MPERERALIVGAGAGLSAALARRASRDGMDIVLAARDTGKLAALAAETGATTVACDASRADEVDRLFAAVDAGGERLDLVIYNPGFTPTAISDLLRFNGNSTVSIFSTATPDEGGPVQPADVGIPTTLQSNRL